MTWHINSRGRVYDPGEDTVIYFDPASGNTHLISRFAAYLLTLIEQDALGTADLKQRAAAAVDPAEAAGLDASITSALEILTALDIIRND